MLHLCGPMLRLGAWIIDFMIRSGVVAVAAIGLGIFGAGGIGITLIIGFAMEWLYPVVFETLGGGMTPGKRALGIRVIRRDGTPIDWTSSLIRNLLRAADFLPVMFVCGILSMVCSRHFQRLGDLAAGTVVIYDRRPETKASLPSVTPIPPPRRLLLDEQRQLVSFAQRASRLSEARVEELARIAAPVFQVPPEQTRELVARLHGVGVWLLGRRPSDGAT